jgi:hypothetical protein
MGKRLKKKTRAELKELLNRYDTCKLQYAAFVIDDAMQAIGNNEPKGFDSKTFTALSDILSIMVVIVYDRTCIGEEESEQEIDALIR